MENQKTDSPKSCECAVKIQSRLLRTGFSFIPIVQDLTSIPPLPGLPSYSRLLDAKGKPRQVIVVSFNFCPWCGRALREIEKGVQNEEKTVSDHGPSGIVSDSNGLQDDKA